jgi:putative transcriptional regulator
VPKTAREVLAARSSNFARNAGAIGPLRFAREQYGLSLREVGEALEIGYANLHAIETGKTAPRVTTALRLARFYETTVEDLFGWLLDEQEDDAVDTVHEGTGEAGLSSAVAGWPHGDPCAGRGAEEVEGARPGDAG